VSFAIRRGIVGSIALIMASCLTIPDASIRQCPATTKPSPYIPCPGCCTIFSGRGADTAYRPVAASVSWSSGSGNKLAMRLRLAASAAIQRAKTSAQ
jgi:hypothetical protein